ncbi:MAG: site-specific DNA-methyltransferase [Alphaproteobacteria bacterium]|nr:site-specific DNA-methyltransferase [Alphaproteobacteria bacterium]
MESAFVSANEHLIIEGDALDILDRIEDKSCRLVITSPPYNIRKEYERGRKLSLQNYLDWLEPIAQKLANKISDDGHICWQVGNYIQDGELFPLDYYFYKIFSDIGLKLRNRIIWHFNFGLHATKRFSGRYETLLWFTKSNEYYFNLEQVLVPQLYPGKRHAQSKGQRAGKPSCNPKGKNPSDFWTFSPEKAFLIDPIWEIPNVKANHPEKTHHPCQFPSELVERCVLSLTQPNDRVLDPFVGAGTTVIAAAKHHRIGVGIDKDPRYVVLAEARLADLRKGDLVTRPLGKPVHQPVPHERVARIPEEWAVDPSQVVGNAAE